MRRRNRSDEATAASRSRRRRLVPGSSGLAARSSWRRRASSAVRSSVVAGGVVVFRIGVASKLIEGWQNASEGSMRPPARSWYSRRAGVTGLVLAAWSSGACTHWKVLSAFPEQVVSARRPQKVRVTRNDSSRIVLRRPEIVGDTLYGAPREGRAGVGSPRPAVALADVSEVGARKMNVVGTAVLAIGTLALAGVIALGLTWSNRAD